MTEIGQVEELPITEQSLKEDEQAVREALGKTGDDNEDQNESEKYNPLSEAKFSDFEISERTLKSLKDELGYETMMEIQEKSIPVALKIWGIYSILGFS